LSGVTTPARIEWQVTTPIKNVLKNFPLARTIRVGNEEISYKNLNAAACQADIVSRNIRGTSIASHAIGDVCYWVEHDIRIVWGDAAAVAPVYDERYKPQWDLSSGSNSLRTYNTTTGFADTAGVRAGAWKRLAINDGVGNLCRVYSGASGALPEEDPADVMGMELASYQKQGKAYPDTGELQWMYQHPAGLQTVETDGKKFKSFTATLWPVTLPYGFDLQSSPNAVKWIREWNETAPAVAGVYEDISHDTVEALPAGTTAIRYHLYGSPNGVPSNFIRGEINESIIQHVAANLIQVGFNSSETSYQLLIGLRNNKTGESIFLNYPAAENIPVIIDTQEFEVTYKGLNAIKGLSWEGTRTRWLRLEPGENELQFFSAVGSVMRIQTVTHKRAM
jgi:hypothetical protein